MLLEQLKPGFPVLGQMRHVAITLHCMFEQAALDGIVIDNENLRGHLRLRFPVFRTCVMQVLCADCDMQDFNIQF